MRTITKRYLSALIGTFACALAVLSPLTARADVFKCTSPGGAVEFSGTPCRTAITSESVQVKPNVLDSSEQRQAALKAENQALRAKLEAVQNNAATQPQVAQSTQAADRMDSTACQRARRDYEVTASSVGRTPAMLKARESMMYGACGMREPDRTSTNVIVVR
jgi:hypothetical protein